MLVYLHIPYGKIIFYVFTILFHMYLLIRSAVESRHFLALILIIPVTAVSLALFKFLKKNVIRVSLNGTFVELATAFEKINSEMPDMKILGSVICVQGRKFFFNNKKADSLIKAMNDAAE